jgi:hypothetical protein
MKKGFSALSVALVAIMMFVSNVYAAPAKSNRNATLQSVKYERSGIVLFFQSSGLSKNDIKNLSLTAHSGQWNMACSFVNDTTNIRCLVSKKLSIFAGEDFHGTLGGIRFTGQIPGARPFPSPSATEVSTNCTDGQTLWYTFEYSNTSYQAEVWSEYAMDSDTFYSLYGVYPEYSGTYIDIDSTEIYHIYGYSTTTSGYGATSADNWNALVSAYEADGFTIQKTGESCDYSL